MIFTREELALLINSGFEQAVKNHKALLLAYYSHLFNDNAPCASCQHLLRGYWEKLSASGLRLLENKKNRKTMNGKFKLREELGSVQMDFGSSEYFNNETLTDAVAIRYLKINPNRIANFAEYPENWKALLAEGGGETKPKQKTKKSIKG